MADSKLAAIVGASDDLVSMTDRAATVVNSSHHQAADAVGRGLVVSARCSEDGVIEALEGTEDGHFVVAVQWHPERSFDASEASRHLFRAFANAALAYRADAAAEPIAR
jgi:putative glutamine amidotransferase